MIKATPLNRYDIKRIVWGQSAKLFFKHVYIKWKILVNWMLQNQLKTSCLLFDFLQFIFSDCKFVFQSLKSCKIMTLAPPYNLYVFKVLEAVTNDSKFRLCLWSYSAHMTFFGTPGSSQSLMSARWLCLMACVKATLCHVTGGQWQEKETAANHNILHMYTREKKETNPLLLVRWRLLSQLFDNKMASYISTILSLGHYCLNYLALSWLLLLPPCSVP